ncbi:MAG: hypothetical protein QOE62_3119, partial [Actinomycetota bacterium]|nr:hypothetical protein [Actinomycetota bacterium]
MHQILLHQVDIDPFPLHTGSPADP